MTAADIEVGMVIATPDYRGYRVMIKRDNWPRSGYVSFRLQRADDPTDSLIHFTPIGTEIEVISA